MSPERWRQIEDLYHAAQERTPEMRAAFLDGACSRDAELRHEVESLLQRGEQAGSFLETHAPRNTDTTLLGQQIGAYRVLSPLGAGGMGEVWKALDPRLNRVVAIKKLKTGHGDRFQREARAIAALNHPHICQIYDVGEDYLVLEYVEGGPLPGPLSAEEAVRLAIQIAGALEEAHKRGILHRDLKPGNILLSSAGTVKVLDFGLAKMADAVSGADAFSTLTATEPGVVMGTLAYMSPEQAQGQPVDARSDIFSFGLVLYHMLSGRQAFTGDSLFAILNALVKEEPPPVEAPPAVERVVKRCLAKLPVDRFQTMADVKKALEQISIKPEEEPPSIAVLPFANMSGDKEQEYFSDGLAEEIINALAQLPGLKVTARTSAFAFRGKEQDITKIAEVLRVRMILEGSVRRAGNRIRVTAQLINAADGYHLWSQRYDRELEDVFAVQDEIASAIAGALQVKLSGATEPPRHYKPNLPAYEAYLKGRYLSEKLTMESLARSKEHFEEAIALDPKFALPHCELAGYFFSLAILSSMPAREAMPKARAAAQKALEIAPSLPEAHATLGSIALHYDYDWKEAERQFGLAMDRGTPSTRIRSRYGYFYLLGMGRAAEATRELVRVVQEDPVNLGYRFSLAVCLALADRVEDAIAECRQVLKLDENFALVLCWMSACYAARGMFSEALPYAERAFSLFPFGTLTTGILAGLVARTGDQGRVEGLLQTVSDPEAYGAPIGLMWFHLVCGNIERAADWMEKAIAQRDPLVIFHARCPIARPLRESPRWPALAKMMNLPDAG